ncbi:NERD domain-containing protein [Reinekea sp.]|jgi:restriction system protein|uniref:nuclease-related domain-containing protein n=1 Tax=Reinekea sp. TaxID=1970455 RepID=UPI00398996E2
MDYSPIIDQFIGSLWYLLPIFVLAGILKSSWFKGVVGEFKVNLLLKLFLSKEKYHLIKNATIPTADGTTQIDHIVVSTYGIFVVETKNMKGWIFGSQNQKQWTQKIFKRSYKFQNPLHQNYKHTKTLEDCLGIDPESIFSVIVFIGDSTFKTKVPKNVTYAGGCIRYIKSLKDERLSHQEVLEVIEKIESGRLQRGLKTNIRHTAHVKAIVEAKESDLSESLCPKCGSEMLLKVAKKGSNAGDQFWGCSTFPKCRAIVKVN